MKLNSNSSRIGKYSICNRWLDVIAMTVPTWANTTKNWREWSTTWKRSRESWSMMILFSRKSWMTSSMRTGVLKSNLLMFITAARTKCLSTSLYMMSFKATYKKARSIALALRVSQTCNANRQRSVNAPKTRLKWKAKNKEAFRWSNQPRKSLLTVETCRQAKISHRKSHLWMR